MTDRSTEKDPATHIVIPDTQAKDGVPTDHLTWIGNYIVEEFHNQDVKIIHLGDHADMPALSLYDKGKKSMEGRRVKADIEAANEHWHVLNQPLYDYNDAKRKSKHAIWNPERHILLGNHEDRITRATEMDAQIDGLFSTDDLDYERSGWRVKPFKQILWLDGVAYSHFFYNPMTGNPYGGTIDARLKNIGHSFTMGHQQTFLYGMRYVNGGRDENDAFSQHGLVAGACLTLDHKVLTADLRYIPIGDLQVGDQLVSFDEHVTDKRSRRFKTGTVLALKPEEQEVFEVTMDDGKTFKATADHLWLTRCGGQTSVKEGAAYQWRTTNSLRVGTKMAKPLDYWEEDKSYDGGYLAGILDGEGCCYKRETTGGVVGQLTIAQKPGYVLDKIRCILLDKYGINTTSDLNNRGVVSLRLKGGLVKIAKALGELRPVRLLPKFKPEDLGTMTISKKNAPKVVSIKSAGVQTIMRIDIDAKTMIVEGYAHHNCYLHDENYKGPQGNAHFRGIVVKHGVHNGSYDIQQISLDSLCRRYEGMSLERFKKLKYPRM